jgi:retron-type reverse transcriptase
MRPEFRYRALPQGSGTSPILSVLTLIVLNKLRKEGINFVKYADDGIIYGDNIPENILEYVEKKAEL